jgi:hypothetical protein
LKIKVAAIWNNYHKLVDTDHPTYLYVREMKSTHHGLAQGRKKKIRGSKAFIKEVSHQTSIMQESEQMVNYRTLNMKPHASDRESNKQKMDDMLDSNEVSHHTISRSNCGTEDISTDRNTTVAYGKSAPLKQFTTNLGGPGRKKSFHAQLFHEMMKATKTDASRSKGTKKGSINNRISFGYGQIQKKGHPGNWDVDGEPMPTASVEEFLSLKEEVRDDLFTLME